VFNALGVERIQMILDFLSVSLLLAHQLISQACNFTAEFFLVELVLLGILLNLYCGHLQVLLQFVASVFILGEHVFVLVQVILSVIEDCQLEVQTNKKVLLVLIFCLSVQKVKVEI
jgi:hypothetical protein